MAGKQENLLYWAWKDRMDNGMPRFCASYKMFFAHVYIQLQKMGRNWIAQKMQMQKQMEVQQGGSTHNAFVKN
ncbi:hypothetical protein GCQ56_09290 [Marinifilum sp. N1E240]|nr:hypothetical protein [uncultured Marinifilum sp.]MPQ47202.1 hypothetical protein [Marinifilum sp. N1E240]